MRFCNVVLRSAARGDYEKSRAASLCIIYLRGYHTFMGLCLLGCCYMACVSLGAFAIANSSKVALMRLLLKFSRRWWWVVDCSQICNSTHCTVKRNVVNRYSYKLLGWTIRHPRNKREPIIVYREKRQEKGAIMRASFFTGYPRILRHINDENSFHIEILEAWIPLIGQTIIPSPPAYMLTRV